MSFKIASNNCWTESPNFYSEVARVKELQDVLLVV